MYAFRNTFFEIRQTLTIARQMLTRKNFYQTNNGMLRMTHE
jgi:hypothetical protein